jgi:hypothetical protein
MDTNLKWVAQETGFGFLTGLSIRMLGSIANGANGSSRIRRKSLKRVLEPLRPG